MKNDKDKLWLQVKPLVDEICDINQAHGFGQREMSPEVKARWEWLWAEDRRLTDIFDKEHPMEPCPECGQPRFASTDGWCHCFPMGG